MTRVVWSPKALADLDAIEAYIAKDNPIAARRLIIKIVKRTKRIESFPLTGAGSRRMITSDTAKCFKATIA
jgi:plasmid stabilization system protein ParE